MVSFTVRGIDALVAGLRERGISFQSLGPASSQGSEGAESQGVVDFDPVKSAWIRDSEGNPLALNELVG